MIEKLEKCKLCPRECGVNRLENKIGMCGGGANVKIALASIHKFEEPCISGTRGSGTVFFSNCNLKCKFCQNYEISQQGRGKEITIEELSDTFLMLQEKGVYNINLVSPTIYVYQIIEALQIARQKGLHIPIVYNTNGYEKEETIELLKDYVDVYLPDLKYASNDIAKRYSGANHYFEMATKCILKMQEQVKEVKINEEGIMEKGLMVRHLILPNYLYNSKYVLKWMKENLKDDTYVSIMAQYFPTYLANKIEKLNRKLTIKEYKEIEKYVYFLNFKNGYFQELGMQEEEYVPKWEF